MYLKRLDLLGFKSFAPKTTFAFEPGISVLCGPNGSGKSNVADAVRWALGEQNARAIRGRRGEDMIFVGSQGRQPLGLAEVSLTLDNSDGRIPLDYDEVRITRRLYRSGESEYLVNGSRVRLKDLHDWLLHAALDPDGYVVVGQGSVDALILQRAEERRAVIENAADIRRHHAKLAETRSKLAATEESLLRCRAVIAELEPLVKRLRTQAERAERYRACRDELEALAAHWFRHALGTARAELVQARAAAADARAEVDRLEAALAEVEGSAADADGTARLAEDELGSREPELLTLQGERSELVGHLAAANERQRGAAAAQEVLRRELAALHERASALWSEADALNERVTVGRAELAAAERGLAVGDGSGDESESASRTAEEQLATLRQRTAELRADAAAVEGSLREARVRLERAEQRFDEARASLVLLESELPVAQQQAAAGADLAEARRAEASQLRRAREELAGARGDALGTLDGLRAEQHRLAGELQRLQIARRAIEEAGIERRTGAGLVLGAGLSGVRGLLGGELRVPDQFLAAVSAALGESVDAVVVEDADGAWAGLRLVQERGAARTGLVPLNGVAEAPPPEAALGFKAVARRLLSDLPLHGFADELVGCDRALETVRARYLALVVVAPDLDLAREAARRLSADGTAAVPWQVVTLAGQAIRWNGEWRAGRDRSAERLVGRQTELAQIDARLHQTEGELAEVVRELGVVERRANTLGSEQQDVWQKLDQAEAADRQAALAAQSSASSLAQLERDLHEARERTPGLESELARVAEQAQALERRLEALGVERSELVCQIEQAERLADRARVVWEQVRAATAQQLAALAAQRSTLEGQEALLERLEGDLGTARQAMSEIEARLEAEQCQEAVQASRVKELGAGLEAADARIGLLAESIAELRSARRRALNERGAIEGRAAELRGAIRSQRTVLEAATIAESRSVDRFERAQGEAQEYLEELDDFASGTYQQRLLVDEGGDESPEPLADPESTRRRMNALRRELRAIGPVGDAALAEFGELRERHEFLTTQTADLEATVAELRGAMEELEQLMRGAFEDAFTRVNAAFREYFARLFGGGHAELVLSSPEDLLETGIDIVARPPDKRLQPLVSLSGGERALTMVALIFALPRTNPAPFCVLDEVDAALDDSNVRRFSTVLQELSERTQFVVVSHNRGTMEIAEALYGITMDTSGVSTVMSLRLPAA